jgi:hypothetical protein
MALKDVFNDLDDIDRDAMERALAMVLKLEPQRSSQIDSMLEEGWERTAYFAAVCCQCQALKLRPWETAPAQMSTEPKERETVSQKAARELLLRMLNLGLSAYEPDPLAAIEAAEKRLALEVAEKQQRQERRRRKSGSAQAVVREPPAQ